MLDVGTLVTPHHGYVEHGIVGIVTAQLPRDSFHHRQVMVCWLDNGELCEERLKDIEVISG